MSSDDDVVLPQDRLHVNGPPPKYIRLTVKMDWVTLSTCYGPKYYRWWGRGADGLHIYELSTSVEAAAAGHIEDPYRQCAD